MAQQDINTGTVDDDGTGDELKAAMLKVQSNFDELYAAIGGGGGSGDWVSEGAAAFSNDDTHTGNKVECTNAGPITVTIEPDSTEDVPEDQSIKFFPYEAHVTLVEGTGVTFIVPDGHVPTSAVIKMPIEAVKHAPNTWWIIGRLATS